MIIYPTENFDSYISNSDALLLAPKYVTGSSWIVLTVEQQDAYLYQAFRLIQGLNGFIGPDALLPDDVGCLAETQFQIALSDVINGFSAGTTETQEVKAEKAGPVEIEYFASASGKVIISNIPPEAVSCLKAFSWVGYDSFTGLGTLRKHR